MAGAGQALDCKNLVRREDRTIKPGDHCAREIAPEKAGMVLHVRGIDRIARQNCHAARTRKPAVTLRIVRCPGAPVTIHIQPGGDARIGPERESVWHRVACIRQQIGEGFQGGIVQVIVDAQQEQDVRARRENRITRREDIMLLSADIAQEQPRTIAPQPALHDCQTQGVSHRGTRYDQGQDQQQRYGNRPRQRGCARYQAVAKALPSVSAKRRRLARIIRATRAIATPRIIRLAGKNAHSTIPQTKPIGDCNVSG